jgi:hypothetical protein
MKGSYFSKTTLTIIFGGAQAILIRINLNGTSKILSPPEYFIDGAHTIWLAPLYEVFYGGNALYMRL